MRGDLVVAFGDGSSVLDRLASGDRAPADGPEHALADVTLLAPVPQPRAIFGIGLNYAAHAAETGAQVPEAPIVFMKLPSSSAPPGGPDEVPDPEDLALRTWVNGELRQDARTSDLVFGPCALVDFLGETCTLAPGDLILTGTPSGVGMSMEPRRFLDAGDVVRVEIERLGAIEHAIA